MTCTKCRKDVSQYANGKRCRDCYNDYMREYMLERYYQRHAEAVELLGGKCAECEVTDDLQVDHVDWRLKRINLAKLWAISHPRFLRELEKCQALCRDCHRKKTSADLREQHRERPWPGIWRRGHGTEAEYLRGCQCRECYNARAAGIARRSGGQASVA